MNKFEIAASVVGVIIACGLLAFVVRMIVLSKRNKTIYVNPVPFDVSERLQRVILDLNKDQDEEIRTKALKGKDNVFRP